MLSPKMPFCTPNQPTMLIAMTRLTSADPLRPKPAKRVSRVIDRPSRCPARPIRKITTSRVTAPRVNATKASRNPIPMPSEAPSTNWDSEPDCPSHCSSIEPNP